jgi:hypothetical protein
MLINKSYFKHQLTKENKEYVVCKHCGKIVIPNWDKETNAFIADNNVCFTHYCWLDFIQKYNAGKLPKALISDRKVYYDLGNTPGGKHLGFAGHLWSITKDGHQWESNNLWNGDRIIFDLADQLPDNAVVRSAHKPAKLP